MTHIVKYIFECVQVYLYAPGAREREKEAHTQRALDKLREEKETEKEEIEKRVKEEMEREKREEIRKVTTQARRNIEDLREEMQQKREAMQGKIDQMQQWIAQRKQVESAQRKQEGVSKGARQTELNHGLLAEVQCQLQEKKDEVKKLKEQLGQKTQQVENWQKYWSGIT